MEVWMEVWMEVGMEVGEELAWEADAREGVGEMGMPAALKRPGKHTGRRLGRFIVERIVWG